MDPIFDSSTITVNLEFDFTERVFTLFYFSLSDILSIIGGLKASISPLLSSLTPLFILIFLIKLSYIIREKMEQNYKEEHHALLAVARNNLMQLSQSIEKGDLRCSEDIHFKLNYLLDEILNFTKIDDVDALVLLGKKINMLIQVLRSYFNPHDDQSSGESATTMRSTSKFKSLRERIRMVRFENLVQPMELRLQRVQYFNKRKGSSIVQLLQEVRQRVAIFNLFNISEERAIEQIEAEAMKS